MRLRGGGADDYPVTVRLERTDPAHAGQVETVRARYVVGCDGARSAVRKSHRAASWWATRPTRRGA